MLSVAHYQFFHTMTLLFMSFKFWFIFFQLAEVDLGVIFQEEFMSQILCESLHNWDYWSVDFIYEPQSSSIQSFTSRKNWNT